MGVPPASRVLIFWAMRKARVSGVFGQPWKLTSCNAPVGREHEGFISCLMPVIWRRFYLPTYLPTYLSATRELSNSGGLFLPALASSMFLMLETKLNDWRALVNQRGDTASCSRSTVISYLKHPTTCRQVVPTASLSALVESQENGNFGKTHIRRR